MSQRPSSFSTRTRRWFICCCLFVALPVGCVSTLLSAMLGPMHFHGEPVRVLDVTGAGAGAGTMFGWQDFRRVDHVADSGVRIHDHTKLGRHHHDAADPGLVVLGAGDHDDAAENAASGSGAAMVLIAPLAVSLVVPPPQAISTVRTQVHGCRFDSCDLPRLDRPPIV